VRHAGRVPVTIKFRIGINVAYLTYLTAGRIAEEEGCAAVGLHARTAAQLYHGNADWDAIATLKQALRIPVFGNGDIWEAEDALRMMRQTGCDGVIVGRGCLGRPWLFRDLANVFNGRSPSNPPDFGGVMEVMFRHARLLAEWFGERIAMRSFRRHGSWYTKGFSLSGELRAAIMRVETLEDLSRVFAGVDRAQPFPPSAMRVIRGKTSGMQKKVSLPEGYLDDLSDATPPGADADDPGDGG
jgi:nifR3 family TIM-barrel protein